MPARAQPLGLEEEARCQARSASGAALQRRVSSTMDEHVLAWHMYSSRSPSGLHTAFCHRMATSGADGSTASLLLWKHHKSPPVAGFCSWLFRYQDDL